MVSDGTAFLNVARAILMVVFSVPHLNICLLTSALSHLGIAWCMLTPLTQREIRRYTSGLYAELRSCSSIRSKIYFVLRGFLAIAWKRMLSLAIIDMVIHLCAYYKGIVFVMIIGAVDRETNTEDSRVFALCAIWSALSMFSVIGEYHQEFKGPRLLGDPRCYA
ncbi:hypothetical protein DL89DRAFT_183813 [Linderina pennispora]|uniref:Uncharacterized protein n=1 Tax=Linderina pennispora TaxID=61395 RepID=A0A1Y1W5G7_9FUNG|nr:uncharacterized protein DL89DRAFT_183813 [Linderina pennispora]ORX68779.1 hypothetical protein DL89DRAFT_183813 [Linderina pennispora]